MKKTVSVLLAAVFAVLTLCACGKTVDEKSGLNIVCTSFPQYDYIKNIIGSDKGLTLLLDDGGDLHSYEPTAQDIITISNADLFVYVGGTSDKWVESTLKAAANQEIKAIALMDYVETYTEEYVAGMEHKHTDTDEHSTLDEHIWLSLRNAAKITQALCEIICDIDTENAPIYKSNAEKYIAELNALDAEYTTEVKSAKRDTLIFADRFPFRYLVEDYGLTYYAAFAGCSSESEASFQTMAFIIDKTKELELPVVLTIDGSDGSIAKSVCEATGAKSAMLDSCQSVSAQDIQNGTSYINIMKSNLNVLREALN
ncbi:MAG: zinc ABC transporter substrate-binding protein [Ruminococcaceae bacterium]|nr:zinc ABC transporter substrate-binding protein [Oscillospiraceae bacterium]